MLRSFLLAKLLLATLAYTLHIILLAYDRPMATERCLTSLTNTHGGTALKASLEIRIDRLRDGSVNKKLLAMVKSFNWPHGSKSIYIHTSHVGLRQQWMSIAPYDITLIVEDDLVLAPSYPTIMVEALKWWQMRNATGQTTYSLDVFAISLQRPQWQMGQNEHGRWRRLNLLHDEHPIAFTFQAPSTWGLIVTPATWGKFVSWGKEFLNGKSRHYTVGAITRKWVQERGEANLISPLMFEYLIKQHQTILYFWLGNSTSIAVARDPGSPYERDRLLDDKGQIRKLIRTLRASPRLPTFSTCHDLIQISPKKGKVSSSFELYYDDALLDRKSLRTVIASLVNSCRRPRIRLIKGVYTEDYELRSPHFSCPPGPINAHAIFEQLQTRPLSISCNYSTGLYPDMTQDYWARDPFVCE